MDEFPPVSISGVRKIDAESTVADGDLQMLKVQKNRPVCDEMNDFSAMKWCALAGLVALFAQPAAAIVDPENLGQWERPTEIGPDKEVPGFLVNLGPTGARAVLTEDSFVVKHVFEDSPAAGLLKLDDVITGVNGKAFATHVFGKFYGMQYDVGYEGPMMDLGNAIEDSEGANGTLALDVSREGEPIKVELKLEPIGKFSHTFPQNCAKSARLAADALQYLLTRKDESSRHIHEQTKVGLAMLAHGKMDEAKALAEEWLEPPDETLWTWFPAYRSIFLSEYFLMTGDERVLPTIRTLIERLYLAQVLDPSLYVDRMHGGRPQAANYLQGGLGHGHRIAGYGTMTITTLLAMLSWDLAERCGIELNPLHVDLAYACIHEHTHESGYMGYRFATGAYTPVGRQGLSILVHQMAGNRDTGGHVQRVTQGLVNAKTRLNDGHGDNAQTVFWALLGIQAADDEAATREVFDYNKAFLNLARTHDGAFVVQPDRNAAEKAYYLSPRIQQTAGMAIVLGTGTPTLKIQGAAAGE